MYSRSIVLGGLALWAALQPSPATGQQPASLNGATAPPMVTVVATDFHLEAPRSVAAGRTAVRLVNRGSELHHLQLVRLDAPHTTAELLADLTNGGPPPVWAHDAGGPNAVAPGGGEFVAVVDLQPGTYALLCLIPSPDGVLHVMKGMSTEWTVEAANELLAASGPAEGPAPDLDLTLTDYAFGFSGPLTAGTHRIRITTVGRQSHEFVLFRLNQGRTSTDILAWFEGGQVGPPPAMPVGGVVGLAPGETNEITVALEPGRYSFLCFLPDAGDGAPHFAHGMVQDYEVR
ncbi:MAG: hypothetical protein P8188_18425 [Gemmatimonadota bacterium]